MIKNIITIFCFCILTGCMVDFNSIMDLDALPKNWEEWRKGKDVVDKKMCSAVKQEFSKTSNPWQAYQNVLSSTVSDIPDDKKAEISEYLKQLQQLKKYNQQQIDQELSNFENDVKTTSGLNCSPEIQSLVTWRLDEYWDKLKKEDEAKKIKEYETEVKRVEKKYGYKFCEGNVDGYVLQGINIPQNCLLHISDHFAHVLQQVGSGTLYTCNPPLYCSFLVSTNNTDKRQVDNARMPGGYFVRTGSFNYNNVLGAGRTVYKLKRLETF